MLGKRHLLYVFIVLAMIVVVGGVFYFLELERKKAREAPPMPTTTSPTISVPTTTIEQYKLKTEQIETLRSLREEHLKQKEETLKGLTPQQRAKVEIQEKQEQHNALQKKREEFLKKEAARNKGKTTKQIAQESFQEKQRQYNELQNLRNLLGQ